MTYKESYQKCKSLEAWEKVLNEFEAIMIKHDSNEDYDRGFYNAFSVAEEVVRKYIKEVEE